MLSCRSWNTQTSLSSRDRMTVLLWFSISPLPLTLDYCGSLSDTTYTGSDIMTRRHTYTRTTSPSPRVGYISHRYGAMSITRPRSGLDHKHSSLPSGRWSVTPISCRARSSHSWPASLSNTPPLVYSRCTHYTTHYSRTGSRQPQCCKILAIMSYSCRCFSPANVLSNLARLGCL